MNSSFNLVAIYYSKPSNESMPERLVNGLFGTALYGITLPSLLILLGLILLIYAKGARKKSGFLILPGILILSGIIWLALFWFIS